MRIDVHPDDLFDKETRGTLTDEERRHLDAHLASCEACRFERQVRDDFERRLANRTEIASLRVLVSGAIASQARRQGSSVGGRGLLTRMSLARKRHWALLLAATLVFACGLAAAQTGIGRRVVAFVERAESLFSGGSAATTTPAIHGRDGPAARDVAPSAIDSHPEPTPPPSAIDPHPEPAPRPMAALGHPKPSRQPAASVEPPIGSTVRSVAETTPPTRANPAPALDQNAPTLFDLANDARRHGRAAEAGSLYRDLQARYPDSAEAKLSSVLLGRMLLDRGDPAAALSAFDSYLATGHAALREEALAGRALAMGRLGRTEEEKQAWSRLVSAYPHSSYVKLATQRLGQTGP